MTEKRTDPVNTVSDDLFEIEPERYELTASPAYRFEIARRDFFKVTGGGLLIVLAMKGAFAQQESGGGRRGGGGRQMPQELAAWLHIDEQGGITVYTGKVEVGQGIRTSLAQVVAEELRSPVSSIRMVMGDTDLTPYDMGTFGSLTTRVMSPQLRKAGAAARDALLDLAAARLKVESPTLTIGEGKIVHSASKRQLTFGELTKGQQLMQVIGDGSNVTPADQWKIAGQPLRNVNGREIVTGAHKYASDISLPGLLYGKILRPPVFGATPVSIDLGEAEKITGVTVVRDGDFIGVAAPDVEKAERALSSIKAEWKTFQQPSNKELFDILKKTSPPSDDPAVTNALNSSARKFEQQYTVAYIAHSPLEPRAAVAEWRDGKLTVWTGTQRPFGVRSELMQAFRLPEDRVRVLVPDTGSGYGGKHTGEAAIEAARLAKASGKPVKVVWTREEEFTWAYFRPAGVIDIRSGIDNDGLITAWDFHNYNSGSAGIRPVYEIPHQRNEFHRVESPLRQGSYRALASTANHFAREVQIDEMAHAAGIDSLEFRMQNLKDERFRAVLQAAAQRFGWGKVKAPEGHGFGIAGGFEKGGYVASCVDVSVDRPSGKVKVNRVVTAFECGAIVNPDGLRNQVEGSIVQGLGGALFEAIEFDNGKVLNPLFSKYRIPRFSDLPELETVLVNRKDLPTVGAGECPIVALAPSISNAIYDASGVRLRSLPMIPNGLKG